MFIDPGRARLAELYGKSESVRVSNIASKPNSINIYDYDQGIFQYPS